MQEVRIEFPCRTPQFLLLWANFDQDKEPLSYNLISGSLHDPGIALFQTANAAGLEATHLCCR